MRKILFFLLVFCINTGYLYGQRKLELFIVRDSDMQGQDDFIKSNNTKIFHVIYKNFFVTNDRVDEVKLKKQLSDRFPNSTDNGICVLDWEGEPINIFHKQNDNKKFNYYKSEFKKALEIAKAYRPNVRFSYFHLLYLTFNGKISDFEKVNSNLDDLIKMQDFIAPAMYVYNPSEKNKIRNDRYMQNKLLQALQVGSRFNLPTYPFIWHRTDKKNAGYELIPIEYFANVVKIISQTSYNGRKARGVLWWHAESYSYRNRSKFSITDGEYRSIKNVNVYQRDLLQKYYNSIRNYIN